MFMKALWRCLGNYGEFHNLHVGFKVQVESPLNLSGRTGIGREIRDEQTDLKVFYIEVVYTDIIVTDPISRDACIEREVMSSYNRTLVHEYV